MNEDRVEVCCETFGAALQDGTDHESYSFLIGYDDKTGDWFFPGDLPAPKFCPWCGAQTKVLQRPTL